MTDTHKTGWRERIKTIISGYLMDITKGHITREGTWSFPNQDDFDRDLDEELTTLLEEVMGEVGGLKVEEFEHEMTNIGETYAVGQERNEAISDVVALLQSKLKEIKQ